ncbi:hypothetical protein DPMN_187033 [Dreissena polymorpha]|uniref:Uncharacterized protein n=1 Tax=Dreissena polymorpha TaxID=45954 RepID=A0A9D4DPD3_DREPO|nr:hypothetical protein DPMN_187033 [Dreissena polymorpha]
MGGYEQRTSVRGFAAIKGHRFDGFLGSTDSVRRFAVRRTSVRWFAEINGHRARIVCNQRTSVLVFIACCDKIYLCNGLLPSTDSVRELAAIHGHLCESLLQSTDIEAMVGFDNGYRCNALRQSTDAAREFAAIDEHMCEGLLQSTDSVRGNAAITSLSIGPMVRCDHRTR